MTTATWIVGGIAVASFLHTIIIRRCLRGLRECLVEAMADVINLKTASTEHGSRLAKVERKAEAVRDSAERTASFATGLGLRMDALEMDRPAPEARAEASAN